MFSGLWKLEGRNWKRSHPPTKPVILRIQNSYVFKAPGGCTICLKEGDIIVLLSKFDKDWWQVRKIGDSENPYPFHVPTSYVSELISEKRVGQRRKEKEGTKHFFRSQENLLTFSSVPSIMEHHSCQNLHFDDLRESGMPALTNCTSKHKKSASFSLSSSWHGQFPKNEKQSSMFQKSMSEKVSLVNTMQESPVYCNLEEMKKEKGDPPSPSCPPVQILENFERHMDPITGRNFYVNTETKEKTWKPPRRPRDSTPGGICGSFNQQALFSLSSSSSSGSLLSLNRDEQLSEPEPLVQKLTYTKSMILSNSRGPRANHRRNLSNQFECYSNLSSPAEVPRLPLVTVLDVPHEVERAGQLNKTKIAEGGRKLKKNWTASLVVLTGNSLVFYKDPKVQAPSGWKPSNSKPESSMDLRGASIGWAQDMSSKKNVIHLRMVTGNEFLLQTDSDSIILEWYDSLQRVIERLDRENPLDDIILRRAGSVEVLDGSGGEEESTVKTTKESRKFSLSWVSSNAGGIDKKKVKNRLKKLLVRRPPLQTLQEKGLIKDQVFGCRLDALCQREDSTVPKFVRLCIEAVDERGLDADGIYRVNGNLATIQKLRFIVDRERAVTTDGRYLFPEKLSQEEKLDLNSSEWEDIHVITGALKMFFRELPEPLIPYSFFDAFVSAVQIQDIEERIETINELVSVLPEPNHDTLKYITSHLRRVMQHAETNRMTTQNIGIVFGPTLMRPEKELFANIAANMVYQNQVVEHFLTYYQEVFSTFSEE
ncbi:rho GTPase-activating protein 9 [Rhinophrynus dorsalis]